MPGRPSRLDHHADGSDRDQCPVQEDAVARRLLPRVRPLTSRSRARCPSRGDAPSPAHTPDTDLGAGAHPSRSRTRRDTADEARHRGALPGGPAALDQAGSNIRDLRPVQENAVARRLPSRANP